MCCTYWQKFIFLIKIAVGAVKKKGVKMGPIVEKKVLPVETDAEKLVNYVCGSNIYVKGEDIKVWYLDEFDFGSNENLFIKF